MASTAKHDWPMVRLGDVCEISIGKTPARKNPEYWGQGHPWLSIRDMNQGRSLSNTAEQITDLAIRETSPRLCKPGTVLFSFKLSIGKVGIAQIPLYTNEAIAAFVPLETQTLLNEYLFHALQYFGSNIEGQRAVMGQTLNKASLSQITIPLPPLEEQRRIAAILDEVEKLSSSQAAKLACLRELLDARSAKIAEEANATKRLDELCDVQGGISLGGARKSYPESAPYLRVANVFRNAIDLSEVKNVPVRVGELEKYSLLSGDILVVEAHGNRYEVGRGAMLTKSLEGHVYQNHLFRVRPNKGIDSEILVQLWNSPRVRKQILRIVSTTSGLNTTSISKIRSIQVPILTSEVQAEFSELLHYLTELIAREEQKLNKVLELSNSLSTRAFQGEL
ncbi:restriction endonuclease subunit S [Corynebacterium sp. HMSC059E07]|uniref:restriction endonuclease subunit S n=1 Tax=Corynebacterium sp. HMSC059E07 TaxID=1739471 RepID=UPI0009F6C0ED|nr:restriction endonuclease subunit S [Corynebacterium sp. HMSC059E07]